MLLGLLGCQKQEKPLEATITLPLRSLKYRVLISDHINAAFLQFSHAQKHYSHCVENTGDLPEADIKLVEIQADGSFHTLLQCEKKKPLKVCIEIEVPDDDAQTIAQAMHVVAEEIDNAGYTPGSSDRAIPDSGRAYSFRVICNEYRG